MLQDHKITDAMIQERGVVSAPDRLTGDAQDNKRIFDNLASAVAKEGLNGLIDELLDTGAADQIGAAVDGYSENTVGGILDRLKSEVDQREHSVPGKGLSTEDYTTAEKGKLAGVEPNANKYTLPVATAAALGGVKQGTGVEILPDGTLNGLAAPAPDFVARAAIESHANNGDIHTTPQQKVITLTHSLDGTVHTMTGLPDAPGIYSAQFLATADFASDNTWAGGYTAKPTGEDNALPDKAFVAGDLVSIVVDTAGKRLGFKLGGEAKWNIFTGSTPPSKPDGLFVQTGITPKQVAFSQLANSAGSWRADLPAMPTARQSFASANVGSVIYTLGGTTGVTITDKLEAYDTISNLWSIKAPLPVARASLAAAAVGFVVYAIGGTTPGISNKIEAYDTTSNLWSTKTQMPTARYGLGASAVGTVVYAAGGYASGAINKLEAYDTISSLWSAKADMPTARFVLAASNIETVIYAVGGSTGSDTNKLEAYDTISSLWSAKADMPTKRGELASAAIGAVVYAVGGNLPGATNKLEAYDTISNLWSTKNPMPTVRRQLAAASVGATMYAVGGKVGVDDSMQVLEAYTVNGDPYPADTLVVEYGYTNKLARLQKGKLVDLVLAIKNAYIHDGTKLSMAPSKVNLDGQGWQDVI